MFGHYLPVCQIPSQLQVFYVGTNPYGDCATVGGKTSQSCMFNTLMFVIAFLYQSVEYPFTHTIHHYVS
ncbi:MAG: hypothetical protein JWL86_7009, partial [Rhizobium sp.]|nr:hypothetical protein [Rhizobium sp.]